MHNILRFLGIVIISAVILFSIGSFYDLSLMKNILLICWSFLFDLLVFVFKQKLLSNFGYLLSVLFLFLS